MIVFEILFQFLSFSIFQRSEKWHDLEVTKPIGSIYCVGDSFTSGFLSEISYPEHLNLLLKKASKSESVVNLGFTGSTIYDHLKIIEKIPNQSVVILRSGADSNLTQDFPISPGTWSFEFRILKLLKYTLSLINKGDAPPAVMMDLANKLQILSAEKKLTLIILPYPTIEPGLSLKMQENPEFLQIPRLNILKMEGPSQYLSFDGTRLNSNGYLMEAEHILQFLYQWKLIQ